MTEDDLKMVEALVQHIGLKIDLIAETITSPMGQILLEELRASHTRLKGIILKGGPVPTYASQSTFVAAITPATAPPMVPEIQVPVSYDQPLHTYTQSGPMHAASAAPAVPTAPPSIEGITAVKKVLFLIDDDKDAQKVLSYMFERKSAFRVVSHTDPIKAWNEIKASPPDLILMDLMMPGLSGLDLLKNIRQIPELKNVKILIGSSKSFDKDRIEVLKAGANDFIAKPYNFTELLLRLNKLAG